MVRYVLKFVSGTYLLLCPKLHILEVQSFWLKENHHKLEFPN